MQHDIDDLFNEASASAFQSSYFPTARIDSGSFADISSSGVIKGDGGISSSNATFTGDISSSVTSTGSFGHITTDGRVDVGDRLYVSSAVSNFHSLNVGSGYLNAYFLGIHLFFAFSHKAIHCL